MFEVLVRSLNFVWTNIPTGRELALTSTMQSFVEIILDNTGMERGFGRNPTAKSFMRDGAKIATAPYYAYTHTPIGGGYVADTFTALGASTKAPIKIAMMSTLKAVCGKTVIGLDFQKLDEVMSDSHLNLTVMNKVKDVYAQYAKDSAELGRFSRISNFVAEPITKTLEGCSKALQDEAKSVGAQYQNTGLLSTMMGVKQFGVQQFLGYSLGNSFVKTSVLDFVGEWYGSFKINSGLKSVREAIEQCRLNLVIGNFVGREFQLQHQMTLVARVGFVNQAVDEAFQDGDAYTTLSYWFAKALVAEYALSSYGLEMLERTAYNTLTMSALATPSRAVGNAIHYFDNVHPAIVKYIGTTIGFGYLVSLYYDYETFETYADKKLKLGEQSDAELYTTKCSMALVDGHIKYAKDSAEEYRIAILNLFKTDQNCVKYVTERDGGSVSTDNLEDGQFVVGDQAQTSEYEL